VTHASGHDLLDLAETEFGTGGREMMVRNLAPLTEDRHGNSKETTDVERLSLPHGETMEDG
jgi:hypothetical protein